MSFDNKKHADALLEAEGLISRTLMLCEGMDAADSQMSAKQYANAADGAFGLMAFALARVYDLISDSEINFRRSHGLLYSGSTENKETTNNE